MTHDYCPDIAFDPFGRQRIYLLLRGSYGMPWKLWITGAVSLIAGVLLASSHYRGQRKPMSAGPAALAVLSFRNISHLAKASPRGIVAGSPTGGNGSPGTIDVASGFDINGTPVNACAGGTSYAINGISYSNCFHYVALSDTTPPVNTSGTTWQYTLAEPITSAAATMLTGAGTGRIEGYTGAATGNNVTFTSIAAATTTTISITNAAGTVANTGAPAIDFSTWDVRTNLCLQAASASTLGNAAGANGNTSSICDGTGEPSQVNAYYQITVGDGAHVVLWKVAPNLYAQFHLAGGRQYAIFQQGDTDIECQSAQNSGCQINNFSRPNGMYALYGTGKATGYRQMRGMWFKSIHGGKLASGHVAMIQAGYDGSLWDDNQFIDDATSNVGNGIVAVIGGNTFCCHSNFTNDTFDSEWGQTAVEIDATPYNQANTINFHNNSINTHGPTATGNPNLLCYDEQPGRQTMISFTGTTYLEGQAAAMTAPFIQDNGCRALEFTGMLTAFPIGGTGSTAPIIAVSSAFDTTLNIGAVTEWQGTGSNSTWKWPSTIVEQYNKTTDCGLPPCAVAVTDSAGNSPGYHSRTSQFNNLMVGGNLIVNALGSSTSPVCPNGIGGALTTSGCSLGTNTSTAQHGIANVQQSFTIAASTIVGYVMSMTTTADNVQPAGLGSTNNVGIATTAGGTNAQLHVATHGKILTVFDGTPVVGDLACAPPISTGKVGLAHDNGTTACPAGQKLGVVTGQVSGTGSGATATVLLQMGN